MVKRVWAATDDVARLWAAQSQEEAWTSSNTSFRGPKFFSYGTCVGLLARGTRGQRLALMSSIKYSSGTSKVVGEAESWARKAGYTILRVRFCRTDEKAHSLNLRGFEEDISEALGRVERAYVPASHRSTAKRLIAEARAYSRAFALGWRYKGPDPEGVRSYRERATGCKDVLTHGTSPLG